MAWITPKTDWDRTDVFAYTDYNRIRNNLLYINDMLNERYPESAQPLDLGVALVYASNYYPSQFNAFEEALESFTRVGVNVNIGSKKVFYGNRDFIDFQELNRLESCCIRWYNLDPAITDVTINPVSFEITAGVTQQLTLTVTPSDATYTVEWSSNNTSVMTVNSNGLVTGVSTGSATITATIMQSNRVVMTVSSTGACIIPVQSISLSDVSLEGCNGQTLTATVIVTPSNATHKNDYVTSDRDTTATTTTKSGMTIRVQLHNNFDDGYETYNAVQQATKYVDVSLDGYSTTLGITIKQGGSIREDNTRYFHEFEIIKKGASASSNITLLCGTGYGLRGSIDDNNDNNCSYRTVLNTHIATHFSSNMSNALKSFAKSAYSSKGAVSPIYQKVHLLAYNEVGSADYAYSPVIPLGTDTYPLIMNRGFISLFGSFSLTRSRMRDNGHYYTTFLQNSNVNWEGYEVGAEVPSNDNYHTSLLLFQIAGTTRVKSINKKVHGDDDDEVYDVYEIDWTNNTSNPRIFDIPLGSVVLDRSGIRN